MTPPPRIMDHLPAVWTLLSRGPAGLITDVDGTISPIVDRPESARLHPGVRQPLRRLVDRLELVAAVSGRPVAQLISMVGVQGMVYVGNHGLETWEHGQTVVIPEARPHLQAIDATMHCLRDDLNLPGVVTEPKGATGTVHYRLSPDPVGARAAILDAIARCPSAHDLWVADGRMVVNILPPVHADKGTAVEHLVRERRLRAAIYLGDDVTDLDAFRAFRTLRELGICDTITVAVASAEAPSDLLQESDYALEGVHAVASFLRRTADWLDQSVQAF